MMQTEFRLLREQLRWTSRLQASALLVLVAGIALLPSINRVEAVSPSLPALLQQHALAAPPVTLDALAADASGIAWNDNTGTLFAVRNSEPRIVELEAGGQSLRSVELHGFRDVEGITWLEGYRFAVVEERDCSVWLVELAPGVRDIHKPSQSLFALPGLNAGLGNQGCEDLAWNPAEQVFYLVKEKSPAMLLRVSGIDPAVAGPQRASVTTMPADTRPGLFGRDMSGLHFDRTSGQLLVLSDESRRITGVGTAADLPALAPAFELGWWRNGLSRPVPQPEGVTLAPDGTLYVLSEPNLLYRFTR